jgi:hypothetical protein
MPYIQSSQPIEIQDLMSRFALDCASEMLFGQNLNTLSAVLPEPGKECGTLDSSGKLPRGVRGSATHDRWGSFVQSFEVSFPLIVLVYKNCIHCAILRTYVFSYIIRANITPFLFYSFLPFHIGRIPIYKHNR